MKLSMYILDKWLESWSPTAVILHGEDCLEGVRMFSQVSPPDPRYVYAARMRDVFPDSESGEVILVNRNDVIRLNSQDIEEVFNEIVSAFEFYSAWEYRLLLSAASKSAFQNIADNCSELFGPTLFQDRTFHIIAMSAKRQGSDINPVWNELHENKGATLQLIGAFAGSTFMESIGRANDNYVFYEERAEPYGYGVLNSYNDEAGNLSGQCMITFDHYPDQADLQLIGMVKRALETVPVKIAAKEGNQVAEMILAEALKNRDLDEFDLAFVQESMGWQNRGKLCMLVANMGWKASASDPGKQIIGALAEKCRQKLPECIVLARQSELVICMHLDEAHSANHEDAIAKRIGFLLEIDHIRVGMSMCFDSLSDSWAFYRQAQSTLEENIESRGLLSFSKIAPRALLRHPDAEWQALCVHPILGLLKDRDRGSGTSYYETLRQFLVYERSYKAVADLQFTHRNTILYRIERIQEMYPLNLEDPRIRSYLMLSFEIDALKD